VHVAEYAGRLAARNAFASEPVAADFDRFEAHAVYTQPQVAVAGLTERACRARGLDVRVKRHPFRDVGKAVVSGEPEGFVKMIVARDGTISGIAIVGDGASELIGEGIALIESRATTRAVADMPHLHPTMSEIFARVADDFEAEDAPGVAVPALD
jgi:pyruvate/2-oxoglutarate dehydrogenase complex dihydrolipoamide dehydrogenase (E3) component